MSLLLIFNTGLGRPCPFLHRHIVADMTRSAMTSGLRRSLVTVNKNTGMVMAMTTNINRHSVVINKTHRVVSTNRQVTPSTAVNRD
jgi:hypothetical protein